jgi:Flp pilus assembly protein TadD
MLATATRYAGGGATAEAKRVIYAILRVAPDFAHAWHVLGTIHYQAGEPLAAALALSEAVRLDATHAPAHALLGELALRAGDRDTARARLGVAVERADALTPKHRVWATYLLARAMQPRVR